MTVNKTLSKNIRHLRTEKNISQQQLADLMFVSRATIANWENGNRVPDITTLLQLSRVLDADIYDLIGSSEDNVNSPIMIVVEDEPVILKGFVNILRDTLPDIQVFGFQSAAEAEIFARDRRVSVAFVDIELCGESGVELAKSLTNLNARTNIIFLTGHTEYYAEALDLHCSGYILKPLTPEKIQKEITHLRFPVGKVSGNRFPVSGAHDRDSC